MIGFSSTSKTAPTLHQNSKLNAQLPSYSSRRQTKLLSTNELTNSLLLLLASSSDMKDGGTAWNGRNEYISKDLCNHDCWLSSLTLVAKGVRDSLVCAQLEGDADEYATTS